MSSHARCADASERVASRSDSRRARVDGTLRDGAVRRSAGLARCSRLQRARVARRNEGAQAPHLPLCSLARAGHSRKLSWGDRSDARRDRGLVSILRLGRRCVELAFLALCACPALALSLHDAAHEALCVDLASGGLAIVQRIVSLRRQRIAMPRQVIDLTSDSDSDDSLVSVVIKTARPGRSAPITPKRTLASTRRAPSASDDELAPTTPQFLRGSKANSFSAHAAVVEVWSPRKRDGETQYEPHGRQQLRNARSQPSTPTKVRRDDY